MPELTGAAGLDVSSLPQLSGEEVSASAVAARLGQLVDAAPQVLGVDSVGLMLLDENDRLAAVAFTDRPASILESEQARLQCGPGIDTTRDAETVLVRDLEQEPRFAELWAQVSHAAVRAVLSSPVWVEGQVVGNFNLVRRLPHTWTAVETRSAAAYARVVGLTVALAAQTTAHTDHLALLAPGWDAAVATAGPVPASPADLRD